MRKRTSATDAQRQAALHRYIEKTVERAPALSIEQQARLSALLRFDSQERQLVVEDAQDVLREMGAE